MLKRVLPYLVAFMLLGSSALYGLAPLSLLPPLTTTAPANQFSAARALPYIKEIGKEIHPMGSPAMAGVAVYLLESLKQIGLAPEIQEVEAQGESTTVKLHNVVVRLPGTAPKGAVLIVSHPDSTPFGPGAGDNATGAAVLLEVARAIKSSPTLQNDIIFLFDDGEENSYLGGYAFAREHPWMADVRLVAGLDTAAWGPVILLQTTPQNGAIIRGYAAAVRSPVAFGFFADAAGRVHDSELTPFVERGLPGIELEDPTGFAGKHSLDDTVDRVNLASVQQMGDQVLAMVRQYGNTDLDRAFSADESYFTLWGLGMVHYPAIINIVLAILAALVVVGVVILGIRRKLLSGKGLGTASLYALALFLGAAMVGVGAFVLFRAWFPPPHPHVDNYLLPATLPFYIAVVVLVIGIYILRGIWIARHAGSTNLAVAGLVLWLLLSLVSAVLLPIGSYVFIWPLLLAAIGWAWILYRRLAASAPIYRAILVVPAVVATILMAPNLIIAYISMGLLSMPLTAVPIVMILDLWSPVVSQGETHGAATR